MIYDEATDEHVCIDCGLRQWADDKHHECAPDLDNFEFTLTLRALRQIKAEAWDEGAQFDPDPASRVNPYRTETP